MKKVINIIFLFSVVLFFQRCVEKEDNLEFPEEIKQLFPENRNKLTFVSSNNDTLSLKIADLSYTIDWDCHMPKKYAYFYIKFDMIFTDSFLLSSINYNEGGFNNGPSSYQLYQINNGGINVRKIYHFLSFNINGLGHCSFEHIYSESSKINDINVSTDSVICLRNGCWDEYYKKGVGLYKMQNKEGVVWTLIE